MNKLIKEIAKKFDEMAKAKSGIEIIMHLDDIKRDIRSCVIEEVTKATDIDGFANEYGIDLAEPIKREEGEWKIHNLLHYFAEHIRVNIIENNNIL